MEIKQLIKHYKKEVSQLSEKLNQKRKDLGEADSAKESRLPTGRNELEDEIKMLEQEISHKKSLMQRLENILTEAKAPEYVQNGTLVKFEMDSEIMEYFLVDGEGDFSQGVISFDSPIGKSFKGMKMGEEKEMENGGKVKILEIS